MTTRDQMTPEQIRIARLYSNVRWAKRARAQLRREPLCKMCRDDGVVQAATIADHVIPHKGDINLFWLGQLQSLCKAHHDSSKQQIEKKGFVDDIGTDGFPVDQNHPFNRVQAHGNR